MVTIRSGLQVTEHVFLSLLCRYAVVGLLNDELDETRTSTFAAGSLIAVLAAGTVHVQTLLVMSSLYCCLSLVELVFFTALFTTLSRIIELTLQKR